MINDKTEIPITWPQPPKYKCEFQTPEPQPIKATMNIDAFASPDFALSEVLNGKKTFFFSKTKQILCFDCFLCENRS